MSELWFGVLGPLEVRDGGGLVTVPAGRRRAVLACLAAHAGSVVSADTLIRAAWGGDPPRDPWGALHTVLSRLRGLLGEQVIETDAGGYRLQIAPGCLDADLFEDLIGRARAVDPVQAQPLVNRALALWRGPAFAEWADQGFARPRVVRLEGLHLEAQELLAAALTETGESAAAVPLMEGLVAAHPFRESAVELLMLALYRSGRQTEALQCFRDHRQALVDELGLDPAPALVDLETRILGRTVRSPPRPPPEVPHWYDTSSAFFGRETALDDLLAAVTADRVTVVTGPGGVGKSRLVAEGLPDLSRTVGLPVVVVELAARHDDEVATTLAGALGVRTAGPADEAVVEHLAAVPHLVVLDNCEHLLDEVGTLVSSIARHCRTTRVLCTSRRRLGVSAERVVPLAPLPVPDLDAEGQVAIDCPSARLLLDRVRRVQPSFSVSAVDVADLARLCRRLDGLPLALELAASRTAASTLSEVLAHSSVDLPGDLDRLDAVVGWSVRLLTEEERALLARLSVFTTPFTLDAVRDVTSFLTSPRPDPGPALLELVESSLVARTEEGPQARYRLLAVVRAYAAALLAESDSSAGVAAAHARWAADLVEGIAADWSQTDGRILRDRLAQAVPEVTAALRWALSSQDLELATRICAGVGRCLHWFPGQQLADLIVEVAEAAAQIPGPSLATGVAAGAMVLVERGELDRAQTLAGAALQMSEAADSPPLACLVLAIVGVYGGRLGEAAQWYRRMAQDPALDGEAHASLALLACYADDLALAREHALVAMAAGSAGSDASSAFARYAAGEVESRTDPLRGIDLLREALREADRVGAEQVGKVARVALLALLVRNDRHDEAIELGQPLLVELHRWGAWAQLWTALRMLAELAAARGRAADAAFLLGSAHGAPAAPPLMGGDISRYAELERRLSSDLGAGVLAGIVQLARGTPRTQVYRRAERLLAQLVRPLPS